jgi:hypothetical protein
MRLGDLLHGFAKDLRRVSLVACGRAVWRIAFSDDMALFPEPLICWYTWHKNF